MQKTTRILRLSPTNDIPPAPPTVTNEALIFRIQKGDGEALWMLHSRHADLLRDVIERCLSEEDDCEDVLREVFEDIRDRAVHYSLDCGRALGWLMTIARRRALQRASEIVHRPAQSNRQLEENAQADEREAAATFGAWWSWLKQAFRAEPLRANTQAVGN